VAGVGMSLPLSTQQQSKALGTYMKERKKEGRKEGRKREREREIKRKRDRDKVSQQTNSALIWFSPDAASILSAADILYLKTSLLSITILPGIVLKAQLVPKSRLTKHQVCFDFLCLYQHVKWLAESNASKNYIKICEYRSRKMDHELMISKYIHFLHHRRCGRHIRVRL
jgi:hypothetical protein